MIAIIANRDIDHMIAKHRHLRVVRAVSRNDTAPVLRHLKSPEPTIEVMEDKEQRAILASAALNRAKGLKPAVMPQRALDHRPQICGRGRGAAMACGERAKQQEPAKYPQNSASL